jgi:predicted aspartyl protease
MQNDGCRKILHFFMLHLALCIALTRASAAASAPAASPVVRIPFDSANGQIEISARVNGTPATFLLDSAAENSVVSSRVADLLTLARDRVGSREFSDDVTLTFGGMRLEHQRVMVMPFDTYYARNRRIDGLLGYDVFSRFVVRIDFEARTIDLWTPTAFRAPKVAVAVPIRFLGRLPAVSSTLKLPDGRSLPAQLVVDTGASQSIILRYPFANENGLFDLGSDSHVTPTPSLASGELTLVDIPIAQASLSRWTFDRPHVQAHREPIGSGASTASDGLIGNGLLSRFTLTMDFTHQRMWLEPRRHVR